MRLPFVPFLALLTLVACDDDGALRSPGDGPPLDAVDGVDRLDASLRDASEDLDARAADAYRTRDTGDAVDARDPDAADPTDAGDPDADEPPEEEGPAVYTDDRSVSPVTPWVARRLREIAAGAPDAAQDVFAKVGASATVSRGFLHCFAGDNVDLGGRDRLQPTLDHFRGGDAAGQSPFSRESVAAVVGWSATSAIAGNPSPVERELDAVDPRFAVVLYGTNDIQRRDIDRYGASMLDLVDVLVGRGVVPVLSSVMPRDDDPSADREVPGYNGVVRGIAQAHQVPFVDLHRELLPLPEHGLAGDNLHPGQYRVNGAARACVFTDAGLQFGYNWRNLLTLQALAAALAGLAGDPPDRGHPPRAEPRRFDTLPYSDLGDTRASDARNLDRYGGCDADQDESGPELVYRLDLDHRANIRAIVVDRGDVDIDLHLLADPADPSSCLDRAHTELRASLDPGTWYFVLDTFVGGGDERAGEFLFVVVEEPD